MNFRKIDELTPDELAALPAEALPDREAMSTITPPGGEPPPGVLPPPDVQDGHPWQPS
jgi:hypothetical protein